MFVINKTNDDYDDGSVCYDYSKSCDLKNRDDLKKTHDDYEIDVWMHSNGSNDSNDSNDPILDDVLIHGFWISAVIPFSHKHH